MANVSITGLGAIGSFGQGISALQTSLYQGKSHFILSPLFPELDFPVVMAPIIEFDFQEALQKLNLPKELMLRAEKSGRRAPLTIQASLLAVLEAWQQANLTERNFCPERVGVVVAGNNTTQGYRTRMTSSLAELSHLSPTYALHFMDTDQIGTITEVLNIHGESFSVGGASASGNVALIQASRLIQQGTLDICLVVGVLADLSAFELQAFYNIGALGSRTFKEEPDKACRPFDVAHDGFILGQASGCVILQSLSSKKNKEPSFGYLGGAGFVLDANRSAESNYQGEVKAIQQALQQAALKPCDINYINTHGSSSPLGDTTEITAITAVFEDVMDRVWLNATKGIIGHCLWSAGILEAIATLLQINDQYLHPNLNLVHPIHPGRFVGQQPIPAEIRTAISHSFGFGGINTSVIFLRGENNVSWH